ncbi:MAG: Rieske 2Fe-2S domain-containing protein [Deltaproteobacteria bacterium]|nr:Rieske 2Fe-2S domain-containing protein [Deltaproteobacteria bacterium]
MSDDADGRRRFLATVTVGGSGVLAAGMLVPAVPYVLDPLLRDAGAGDGSADAPFVRLARLDALPTREPRRLPVIGDAVDAWTRATGRVLGSVWARRAGERVTVLSTICPHLGCPIGPSEDGRGFACPCHTSLFAADGSRVSGPSPRGMDPLPVRVRDGVVEVRWQRFRQGTAEREVVGDASRACAAVRSRRA